MLNIILSGPPGAGKGTQSANLIERYRLVHMSTGNILRDEISAKTPRGLAAKSIMDQGMLVSDQLVIDLIRSKLQQNAGANGFVFDGFPRTLAQAKALDEMLADQQMAITCMIGLEVDDKTLIERLMKRAVIEGRTDDNPESIQKRLDAYNQMTRPLADYYRKNGKYFPINGVGTVEDIYAEIKACLGKAVGSEKQAR